MEKIRSEYIKGITGGEKDWSKAERVRLRWYGQVLRRDSSCAQRKVMELQEKMKTTQKKV